MKETLYVHRPLLNGGDLLTWAEEQGFKTTLSSDDLHTTIAFSKKKVDWDTLSAKKNKLRSTGGDRSVGQLGEKGAIVLHFEDPKLTERWQEILDAGASWEHDGYHPHLTISYDADHLDPDEVEPYSGPLIFGPEKFAPLDPNWDQKIKETPVVAENCGVLPLKSNHRIKYRESITENTRMTDLTSLLMKNIDLILEAYNVDEKGNLVVANKKKVSEADEVFHQYFVKSMNKMFRELNEADPIMGDPNGMNLDPHGIDDLGMDGNDMFGDNVDAMGAMDHGTGEHELAMMAEPTGEHDMGMGSDMGLGGMGAPMGGGAMGGAMGESTDWIFDENTDLDIDSLFDLNEEDEEDCDEEEKLDEFAMMGGDDDMMGDSMDHMGGTNDFGGDMGGMGDDLDSGMDHHGDMMGDDDDMVTIHGTTDQGADFEFSFDPNTLGFDGMGDEMGGDMMGDMDDMGGHEHHEDHHEEPMDHSDEPGFGSEETEDEGEKPVAEAAKKGRRSRSSKMGVVPANPASGHAAPFPTAQGQRQKRK